MKSGIRFILHYRFFVLNKSKTFVMYLNIDTSEKQTHKSIKPFCHIWEFFFILLLGF